QICVSSSICSCRDYEPPGQPSTGHQHIATDNCMPAIHLNSCVPVSVSGTTLIDALPPNVTTSIYRQYPAQSILSSVCTASMAHQTGDDTCRSNLYASPVLAVKSAWHWENSLV